MADALSRTIFPGDECDKADLSRLGEMCSESSQSIWKWRDGVGSYEDLLREIADPLFEHDHSKTEALRQMLEPQSVARLAGPDEEDRVFIAALCRVQPLSEYAGLPVIPEITAPEDIRYAASTQLAAKPATVEILEAGEAYTHCYWYSQIMDFLVRGVFPEGFDRVQKRSLQARAAKYKWEGNAL